jgi:hypothetical protein
MKARRIDTPSQSLSRPPQQLSDVDIVLTMRERAPLT